MFACVHACVFVGVRMHLSFVHPFSLSIWISDGIYSPVASRRFSLEFTVMLVLRRPERVCDASSAGISARPRQSARKREAREGGTGFLQRAPTPPHPPEPSFQASAPHLGEIRHPPQGARPWQPVRHQEGVSWSGLPSCNKSGDTGGASKNTAVGSVIQAHSPERGRCAAAAHGGSFMCRHI